MAQPRNLSCAFLLMTATMLLSGARSSGAAQANAHAAAPNFTRVALDHKKVTLSAFRGKVVLLNFWASWCDPCLAEIPQFIAWQREYGQQGLAVIGISMDDDQAPAEGIARRYVVNYPVVMGDAKLGKQYGGVLGLPETFLIDRHGKIRFNYQGATDLSVIEGEMKSLLRTH
jgi:cytochrome c biogenesis protein CcmG, thiol:disulfide interchange protein DsbE